MKKVFQALLAACLDVLEKSDNVVLMSTVMGFVKEWLLKPRNPFNPAPSLSDQVRVCSDGMVGLFRWSRVVIGLCRQPIEASCLMFG